MKEHLKRYWLYYAAISCGVVAIVVNRSNSLATWWSVIAMLWLVNCFLKQIELNSLKDSLSKLRKTLDLYINR